MHAVIDLQGGVAVFAWFLNDRPMGARGFSSCENAIRWSSQMQSQSWAAGWRHVPESEAAVSSKGDGT